MSILRNYDSDTARIYTDKHSFNISDSDNVSQTLSTKNTTLEDNVTVNLPETEVHDLISHNIETNKTYWRELIDRDKPYMLFDVKTIKKHCHKKLSSNEIDRKAEKHYREILAILNTHQMY